MTSSSIIQSHLLKYLEATENRFKTEALRQTVQKVNDNNTAYLVEYIQSFCDHAPYDASSDHTGVVFLVDIDYAKLLEQCKPKERKRFFKNLNTCASRASNLLMLSPSAQDAIAKVGPSLKETMSTLKNKEGGPLMGMMGLLGSSDFRELMGSLLTPGENGEASTFHQIVQNSEHLLKSTGADMEVQVPIVEDDDEDEPDLDTVPTPSELFKANQNKAQRPTRTVKLSDMVKEIDDIGAVESQLSALFGALP